MEGRGKGGIEGETQRCTSEDEGIHDEYPNDAKRVQGYYANTYSNVYLPRLQYAPTLSRPRGCNFGVGRMVVVGPGKRKVGKQLRNQPTTRRPAPRPHRASAAFIISSSSTTTGVAGDG